MKKTFYLILSFLTVIFTNTSFAQEVLDNESLRITHGPWIQDLTSTGVTIIWTTNRPAVPSVNILEGERSPVNVRNSTDGIFDGGGTLHKVRIEGLRPGVRYQYRLTSTQILKYQAYRIYYGDTLTTAAKSFTTVPSVKENVRFTVFNDVHENSGKLGSYLRNNNIKDQDFYVFNGDMVDFLQDPEQLYKGFIDTAVKYFAAEKPFIYVRGNHETRGYRAREIKNYFDYPNDRFYYSFDIGKIHFTVLDGGEDKPDENRYYYGMADFDGYRLNQLEWLKQEVASESFRKADRRILIVHFPVIKQEKQGYGMQFLADKFGPLLKEVRVDLMLSAHTHRTAFYEMEKTGFGYPLLVNSNNSFVELVAGKEEIRAVVKDITGKVTGDFQIK